MVCKGIWYWIGLDRKGNDEAAGASQSDREKE